MASRSFARAALVGGSRKLPPTSLVSKETRHAIFPTLPVLTPGVCTDANIWSECDMTMIKDRRHVFVPRPPPQRNPLITQRNLFFSACSMLLGWSRHGWAIWTQPNPQQATASVTAILTQSTMCNAKNLVHTGLSSMALAYKPATDALERPSKRRRPLSNAAPGSLASEALAAFDFDSLYRSMSSEGEEDFPTIAWESDDDSSGSESVPVSPMPTMGSLKRSRQGGLLRSMSIKADLASLGCCLTDDGIMKPLERSFELDAPTWASGRCMKETIRSKPKPSSLHFQPTA